MKVAFYIGEGGILCGLVLTRLPTGSPQTSVEKFKTQGSNCSPYWRGHDGRRLTKEGRRTEVCRCIGLELHF